MSSSPKHWVWLAKTGMIDCHDSQQYKATCVLRNLHFQQLWGTQSQRVKLKDSVQRSNCELLIPDAKECPTNHVRLRETESPASPPCLDRSGVVSELDLLLLHHCCFTSTKTVRTITSTNSSIREGVPRRPPRLSYSSWALDFVQCCFTSTETVRTIKDGGAQDVHLDLHTAPELRGVTLLGVAGLTRVTSTMYTYKCKPLYVICLSTVSRVTGRKNEVHRP